MVTQLHSTFNLSPPPDTLTLSTSYGHDTYACYTIHLDLVVQSVFFFLVLLWFHLCASQMVETQMFVE